MTFSRARSGLRLKASLYFAFAAVCGLALSACGDSQKTSGPSAVTEFNTKFANDKAAPPATLPVGGDWVVFDKTGNLLYRLNLNTYCLVTAVGQIAGIKKDTDAYYVTYFYQNFSNTGNVANCQANDANCYAAIAECQKQTKLMLNHAMQYLNVKIPNSGNLDDGRNLLKPSRL